MDLPFAFSDADAFFACSSAAVFSLAMVAGEMREGKWCGGESEHAEQGGRKQREGKNAKAQHRNPRRAHL